MEQNTSNHEVSGRSLRVVAAVVAVVAALAACGQDAGSGGTGTGDSGMSVSIVEPASGASVSVPFTVKVQSSVPLGTTDSGKHHVHVWFDDNSSDYMVVESDSVQVTNLSAGSHVVHVSLRNANHSAAGAENQSTVMVGGGGAPGATPGPATSTDPYGY
jgi:hypothetical protein